jgi:hypothetical protein
VTSFGLSKALTYFMDMMNKVFMEYLDKFVIVFINDILVCTKDEEHKKHFRLVLQKLKDHRLYAKLRKREFWMKQVTFLSHIILEEGMSVDSSKIQDMLRWNVLASVANIQSPLRLVESYLRFIEGISKVTKLMTKMLGKDKKFK